jgi:SAM-dependent methyltransferase
VSGVDESVTRWAAEYKSKGLPSSFRHEPSGAVCEFVESILRMGVNPERSVAVDAGCGTGRNSLYLANRGFTVYALDRLPELISTLHENAKAAALELRLHAICADVGEVWPVASGSASVAIDTFCYKHLMTAEARLTYRQELTRVLQSGGVYLLTLASIDDGYYGELPFEPIGNGMRAITDPANRIASVLYERAAIESCFRGDFAVIRHAEKRKPGPMHGGVYDRVTHTFVMRRV